MGAEIPGIVRLRCSIKNYDWGKLGEESAVARLYSKNSGEEVDGGEPYAEFWMGTHESGPSYVVAAAEATGGVTESGMEGKHGCDRKQRERDVVSLKDWIEHNPSVLGDKVLQKWGPTLPFLFKVIFQNFLRFCRCFFFFWNFAARISEETDVRRLSSIFQFYRCCT